MDVSKLPHFLGPSGKKAERTYYDSSYSLIVKCILILNNLNIDKYQQQGIGMQQVFNIGG